MMEHINCSTGLNVLTATPNPLTDYQAHTTAKTKTNPVVLTENAGVLIVTEQAASAAKDVEVIKVLLLGTGDSGKTTLRKQMRNVFAMPFTKTERESMAVVVLANLLEGCLNTIRAMYDVLQVPFESDAAKAAADKLLDLPLPSKFKPEVASLMKIVIPDPGFQTALSRRSTFQLQDCWDGFAASFMEKYPAAWGGPDYLPTSEECVAARIRTSGIVEEKLIIHNVNWTIFDVGGQRAERRKWIHSFEQVSTIIFVAGIAEYDLVLFEDSQKNRLQEAFDLFQEITNSAYFQHTPIMLFLNKQDLFEKKFLQDKVPINVSGLFPDAPTADMGMEAATKWFVERFKKVAGPNAGQIYAHVTVALDPMNIKHVLDDVTDIVLKLSLAKSGFMVGP